MSTSCQDPRNSLEIEEYFTSARTSGSDLQLVLVALLDPIFAAANADSCVGPFEDEVVGEQIPNRVPVPRLNSAPEFGDDLAWSHGSTMRISISIRATAVRLPATTLSSRAWAC